MIEEEIVKDKLKDLSESVFSKLDELEKSYLVFVYNKKNKKIKHLQNLIDKTTNYYYKTLAEYEKENKLMPDESVMMFNLLEGNKHE